MTDIAELHEKVYAHLTTKYPELSFSLRKINNGGRLEAGYWFHGNDQWLLFTFWNYWNWKTKKPPIHFSVWGSSPNVLILGLEWCEDQRLNNFMAQELMPALDIEHYKSIEADDILIAIDKAIAREKRIIDNFIKADEYAKQLFINYNKEDFKKNKAKIELYRKVSKQENIDTQLLQITKTFVEQLSIQHITHFVDKTIDFHPNLTCFIGANGMGKTTLLRAVALGLVGVTENGNDDASLSIDDTQDGLRNLFQIKNINEKDQKIEYAQEGCIEIGYKTGNTDECSKIIFTKDDKLISEKGSIRKYPSIKNDISYKIDEKMLFYKNIQKGNAALNCLIIGISQNNSNDTPDKAQKGEPQTEPHLGDIVNLILNKPDETLNLFIAWLHYTRENNKDVLPIILPQIITVLKVVTNDDTLEFFEIKLEQDDIFIKTQDAPNGVPLRLLSQGYTNVIGFFGYMMQRLYEVSIDKNDFMNTPAIVLIDEIDTYLHPQWQSTITAVLVEKFPNIQFIITTHSPYVVGSVPSDKIKIYTCLKNERGEVDVAEFKGFTAYGADIKELSARLYGNIERPVQAIQAAFVQLFSDLERFENSPNDSDLYQKISATIADLESKIHATDPELLSAKSQLEMIMILNEMEKEGAA